MKQKKKKKKKNKKNKKKAPKQTRTQILLKRMREVLFEEDDSF